YALPSSPPARGRAQSPSSCWDDEPVTDATDRLDPARFSELTANLMDRLLEAVLKTRVGAAPHSVQDLGAGHHLGAVAREQLKHQERTAFELQRSIAKARLTLRGVDVQTAAYHRPRRRRSLAQRTTDRRQHHLSVSPFDDVVGGAALESDDLVSRRMPRAGQDDHRKRNALRSRSQRVEHLGR